MSTDTFTSQFPYPLTSTNLPGAYATPRGASAPQTHTLLERVAHQPLRDTGRIIPHLEPQPGVRHVLRGRSRNTDGQYNSNNWAGGSIAGAWKTAVGTWVLPTVSKPTEAQGGGGGWWLSSWVGIDGTYGSNDVLQAGVNQHVDSSGTVSASPWFEWYCSVSKNTLGDTSPLTPAIASLNGRLYIAWKGDGNDNLNLMYSADNGATFGNKYVSGETTTQAPALTAHNGSLYIAWKGDGNDNLNVAEVAISGETITGFVNKQTLGDTTPLSPALASANGRLYLAWKGDGNNNLNLMYSAGNGASFGGKFTSPETSPQAPALCAHNNLLIISWKGDSNDNLNVAQLSAAGNGFVNKTTVPDTSPLSPAVASFGGRLYLAWKGDGNDNLNLMYSTDNGASFTGKYTSGETSAKAPALTVNGANLFYGWKGDGNDNLNVSLVGIVDGNIDGWTTPGYVYQTNISNLPVNVGDSVGCSVAYASNNAAGSLTFANYTTGQHFSITLIPPPGATFDGNSSEWIGETPGFNNGLASLAKFTPLNFSSCTCGATNGTTNNPQNGDTVSLTRGAATLATASIAADAVSVTFAG